MKWASFISPSKSVDTALSECIQNVQKTLGEAKPDLVIAFYSSQFEKNTAKIHKTLQSKFKGATLIGGAQGGLIGSGSELESHPGLTLLVAHLPDVEIRSFQVTQDDIPDLDGGPKLWHNLVGVAQDSNPTFLLVCDPFSIAVENFLMGMDFAYPRSLKIGGLCSNAVRPGRTIFFLNDQIIRSGIVGVSLAGNVEADAIVAQGCRPIGPQFQITAADQNVLLSLDGASPLSVFEELFESLDERDRHLARESLFLGIATMPGNENLRPRDFLVRNVIGVDPKNGYIAVGAYLRVGQTVQFYLRDAQTAHEDLDEQLRSYASQRPTALHHDPNAEGILMFSCFGRGQSLFARPNHDISLFEKFHGPHPTCGFFCNGELGPVGGTTYLHGYTSVFAILREKSGGPIWL